LNESEFSLGGMLAEECAHLRPIAESRRVRLACDVVHPSIWIRTDRVKLERVVANLIDNAIKFSPGGAVHAARHRRSDGGVEIAVRDTGAGIPADQLDRVFDEFFQLRNPERDRDKGRGLGLAISKRLVSAMGGDIGVESGPGGSTFVVRVPADAVVAHVSAVGVLPARTAPGGAALAGGRVLIMEDHRSTR